jgi:hypothetical protein
MAGYPELFQKQHKLQKIDGLKSIPQVLQVVKMGIRKGKKPD